MDSAEPSEPRCRDSTPQIDANGFRWYNPLHPTPGLGPWHDHLARLAYNIYGGMNAMTRDQIIDRVRPFVESLSQTSRLAVSQDLFAPGFVNSLEAVQLVVFLEKEFGIAINEREQRLDSFRTLNAIADLVQRKMA
jgi:methoxymalonate biosynthesis acyl carrier protein